MNNKLEENVRISHVLTRLGIIPDVQALFLDKITYENDNGSLVFDYGDDFIESYGFGFHLIPSVPGFWKAGCLNLNIVTDVIIGYSALNLIAYFSYKYKSYSPNANILFLSIGTRVHQSQLDIIKQYKGKRITLVFDNDLLGKIADVKIATTIFGKTANISVKEEKVSVIFRKVNIKFDEAKFSLSAFKKAFRMNIALVRTEKNKNRNYIIDHTINAF